MTMYENNAELLSQLVGRGIRWPSVFDVARGVVATSTYADRIKQSIYLIMSTRPGERIHWPEIGSLIYLAPFTLSDSRLIEFLKRETAECLRKNEKRINIVQVNIIEDDNEPNMLGIEIIYFIRDTNIHDSYVYPFQKSPMPIGVN